MAKLKYAALALLLAGAALLMAGVVIWKAVIAPKDTRLRFYEIAAETKNSQYNKAEKIELSPSWLSQLGRLNPDHLRPCERLQYHNLKAGFERGAEKTEIFPSSLQTVARKYSADILSLETLAQFGEAEFEKTLSELRAFETQYREAGGQYSLDALAAQPQNFRSDPNEVKEIYEALIAKGEQSLAPRFYDYDIPKGAANVVRKAHRFSAHASYDRRAGALVAYFDEASYDVSIAAFISVHEIFPGHHLHVKSRRQGFVCAGENPRRYAWLAEGWATYGEFMADEDGFFKQPEHKLAWLDYRLIRAMRLILDVERMHGAARYDDLKSIWETRMPGRLKPRFDRELNRLVKSNHQHVSYLLGYRAVMEVKTRLMDEMGGGFDEKAFHDAMLRLDHQHPEILYETVKIAMARPQNRARQDSALHRPR